MKDKREVRRPRFGSTALLSSRLGLAFGIEGFGSKFAVRFFEEDFHAAFGFLELLLTLAREGHALFKEFHSVIERKLRRFQAAHDFFETRQRAFKIRLLGRLGFFGGGLVHEIVCILEN